MITTLTLQCPLADIIFKVNIFLGQLQMFMIYSSTQTNNDDQAKWKRLDVQTATEFIQAGKKWYNLIQNQLIINVYNVNIWLLSTLNNKEKKKKTTFQFQLLKSKQTYDLWTCKKTSSACLKRNLVLTFISFHTFTLKNPTISALHYMNDTLF